MKTKDLKKEILTIPNLLSLLRLALIPVIIWLYCIKESPEWTAAVVLLSGATDIVDGFIARRFNMITDLGKALDPIADKLTQVAVLVCLVTRFPIIWISLCFMVVKELVAIVLRSIILKRTGAVQGAVWHGKLNTVVLHATLIIHILWYSIPTVISYVLVGICTFLMAVSFTLYTVENLHYVKESQNKSEFEKKPKKF